MLPGSMSLSAEYNRHGSCLAPVLDIGQQKATMLLCKRDNDNDAGFPRSDGRLSSLPEPIFRYTNRDFLGEDVHVCANKYWLRRAPNMAATLRRRLSASFCWAFRAVSTVSGGFSLRRFNAARSRRALNRSSFSWLVS